MPYKAREVLAKLQRAGFVVRASQVRMLSCVILMVAKLMSQCTPAMCRTEHFGRY
jgi:hypothetical protein